MNRTVLGVGVLSALLLLSGSDSYKHPPAIRHFGLYVSADVELANAGMSLSDDGLNYAKQAGFDTVISYDLFQANPAGVRAYLDAARQMGISVVINLQEWGHVDDPVVQRHYDSWYGSGPEHWAATIVRTFAGHPAVSMINITDEYPASPDTSGGWYTALRARQELVSLYTGKPIMLTMLWSNYPKHVRRDFFGRVLMAGDVLAIDHYPIPENPNYGRVSNIGRLGQDLAALNPGKGWFVAQAFAWSSPNNRKTGQSLGFPPDSPAPTVEQMVDMVARAFEGGAQNVMFYSLPDLDVAERANLKAAMASLRQAYG